MSTRGSTTPADSSGVVSPAMDFVGPFNESVSFDAMDVDRFVNSPTLYRIDDSMELDQGHVDRLRVNVHTHRQRLQFLLKWKKKHEESLNDLASMVQESLENIDAMEALLEMRGPRIITATTPPPVPMTRETQLAVAGPSSLSVARPSVVAGSSSSMGPSSAGPAPQAFNPLAMEVEESDQEEPNAVGGAETEPASGPA